MVYSESLLNKDWGSVPDEVKKQTKRCIRDIIATAAGASLLPDIGKAGEFIGQQFGVGEVPLWFQRRKSSMVGASFFNSFLVDSLDYHDGFRPCKGHAGATVVPVVISACAGRGLSGKELLVSVLMGYEIACRAGTAIHELYKPAYHSSGSWASIGAAAAGARIYKFREEDIDRIAGVAEYYAPMSPMIRCTSNPCSVKDGAAAGAWSAAMALEMYKSGLTGLPSILTSEEKGREAIESLGDEWLILKQYFKAYPSCRWTHPALEAAVGLQQEYGFGYEEIERIEVFTFREGMSLNIFPPATTHEAQYCLPWAVAAVLVDRGLGIDQVHPKKLKDKRITGLGRKVTISYDSSLQSVFPEKCLQRVVIELKDGKVMESAVTGASGDYDKPIRDEKLKEKFIDNLSKCIGKERSIELLGLTEGLERYGADDMMSYLV
jgi:2-methylcitrate dehydratase PrpD